MNLLGISWGMSARDEGMKSAVDSALSGLDKLNRGLEQQSNIAGKSKAPGLWAKMKEGVKGFNVASMASDIHALTGDTGNLTNGLEAMGAANAKVAAPFVASMNLSAAAARKMTSQISGMSIGMKVGAETVAEVFKAVTTATGPAKESLDAFGMSNKEWVKTVEVTGMKMGDYTDITGGMGALWKVSAKDGKKFIDRIVEMGKLTGLGIAPLKGMKENLDALAVPFEKLPPTMQRSGEEMTGLAESATRMGGVFKAMGQGEEEAVKSGMGTAQMFADQAVVIERANAGMGGSLEDSPLLMWLTTMGVSMQDAQGIVELGSRDVVAGMQAVQSAFKNTTVDSSIQQAAMSKLNEAMGGSVAGLGYLTMNLDAGGKAMEEMNKITLTGKYGLKDYANQAFKSGMTLQESFDLAKDSFDTTIRSISRKDVRALISEKMGGFREVGKEMKALAAEGGPMGMLVKGMSMFKQMGIQGVLLQIGKAMGMDTKAAQKMGIKINLAFETVQGLAQELGPVMNLLGQFGPLGLLGGGIVGFFLLSKEDQDAIWATVQPILEKVGEALGMVWERFKEWWNKTDFTSIKTGLGNLITEAIPYVEQAFYGLLDVLKGALGSSEMVFGVAFAAALTGGGFTGAIMAGVSGAVMLALAEADKIVQANKKGVEAGEKALRDKAQKDLDKTQKGLAPYAPGAAMTQNVAGWEQDIGATAYETGNINQSKDIRGASDTLHKMVLGSRKAQEAILNQAIEDEMAKGGAGGGYFDRGALEKRREQGMELIGRSWNMRKLEERQTGKAFTGDMILPPEVKKAMAEAERVAALPQFSKRLSAAGATDEGSLGMEVVRTAEAGKNLSSDQVANTTQAMQNKLDEAANSFADSVSSSTAIVGTAVGAVQTEMAAQSATMATSALAAGGAIVAAEAQGIDEGAWALQASSDTAMQGIAKNMLMNSPIEAGPLAGVGGGGEGDPAFMAGRGLMETFAAGIDAGAIVVADAVSAMLDNSIYLTFDAYKVKMEELASKKSLLNDVARMMVQDFGGSIAQDVKVGDKVENVKQTMQTMLNIPGLAGVTMAIINESAKQRALLTEIRDSTGTLAKTVVLDKGGKSGHITLQ